MADFTWFDFIIFGIIFVTLLMGLARGLFREAISIVSLIIALVVAVKFTSPLANFLYQTKGSKDVIAVIAGFIAVDWTTNLAMFTWDVALLLLCVGTYSVCEAVNYYVTPSTMTPLVISLFSRLVGAGLGAIRGYGFAVITVLVLQVAPIAKNEAWTRSVLLPKIQPAAMQLGNAIQPGIWDKANYPYR